MGTLMVWYWRAGKKNQKRKKLTPLGSPANQQLRLPPEPTDLLQLRDVGNGDGPRRMQVVPVLRADALDGAVRREGDAGDRRLRADVDVPLLPVVAGAELDGAGGQVVVGACQRAEALLGVLAAGRGLEVVGAEGRLDGDARSAAEEVQQARALFAVLGRLGRFDVAARRLVRDVGIVRGRGAEFFRRGAHRAVAACAAKVVACYGSLLHGWGGVHQRGRRQRSLVGLAGAQESDCELSIGGHALEDAVAQLEQALPVRELSIQPHDAALDDGVAEEAEADAEGDAFGVQVRRRDETDCQERHEDPGKAETGRVRGERRRRGQDVGEALPGIGNVSNDVHDGPHLVPHGRLHRHLGLVLMRTRLFPRDGQPRIGEVTRHA